MKASSCLCIEQEALIFKSQLSHLANFIYIAKRGKQNLFDNDIAIATYVAREGNPKLLRDS